MNGYREYAEKGMFQVSGVDDITSCDLNEALHGESSFLPTNEDLREEYSYILSPKIFRLLSM